MSFPFRCNGWIPDANPEKDFRFGDNLLPLLTPEPGLQVLGEAPAGVLKEVYLPKRTPISNQFALGSCVANAVADALEILLPVVVQLSRLFIYWNSRNYHGATMEDSGTYIRYAFDSVNRYGVCEERMWPYDTRKFQYQPPVKAYLTGDSNKVHGYYRIYATGDRLIQEIIAAIDSGHPVVFGTLVSTQWMDLADWTVVSRPSGATRGGHAMVIVGYRLMADGTVHFWIRNSWGTNWGVEGYGWMHQDYITWSASSDFWVPTHIPVLNLKAPS